MKSKYNKKRCATLVMALPLAVAGITFGTEGAQALPLASALVSSAQAATDVAIKSVTKLNPTTVEVNYANGKQLTIDFYGDNIFRLFRDDNGGVIRDPQATPAAKILVDNARRSVMAVDIRPEADGYVVATSRVAIRLSKNDGLLSIVDTKTGDTVVESVAPVSFDKGATTLVLKTQGNEYFYGGGVQNGRFSHKGKSIAIENKIGRAHV